MARPERYNVDYFPHKIDHGSRMMIIERKFGNDGYAVWFKLLERLGKRDHHYIDLNDETERLYLESLCLVDENRLLEIIRELVRVKAFDRDFFEKYNFLYCSAFAETIKDAYRKRNNKITPKQDIPDINIVSSDGNLFKSTSNTQSKVKESKVKYMYKDVKDDILGNEQLLSDIKNATSATDTIIKNKLSDFPKAFRSDTMKTQAEWLDYAFNWTKIKLLGKNPPPSTTTSNSLSIHQGFKTK